MSTPTPYKVDDQQLEKLGLCIYICNEILPESERKLLIWCKITMSIYMLMHFVTKQLKELEKSVNLKIVTVLNSHSYSKRSFVKNSLYSSDKEMVPLMDI